MARIRTIKPDYYKSLDTADWSLLAFALGPGLLCHCDDDGRAIADPRLLASELGPIRDEVTPESVAACLDEWAASGFLELYEVDGRPYLQVRKWEDHQRINRPTPSKLPPPEDADTPHERLTESAVSNPSLLTGGKEGKGKEGNREVGDESPPDDGPTHRQVFDRLAKVCGLDGKLTRAEGGRVAKAAKGIRPVLESVDEIDAKARAYRRKWPDLDMTPTALEANWSQLDASHAGGRPRPPVMETVDDSTWLGDTA